MTTKDRPVTLGALRSSGYKIESVKDEIRRNLITKLESGEPLFPDILGYEETVVPQVCNAILSKHDMLFLGPAWTGQDSNASPTGSTARRRNSDRCRVGNPR